ncbi:MULTISPECIES: hypothetical protein [unclassified Neorhizobium]|nr:MULTISPECIES: hypothetical protein [unclassified Neorhizobium]
MSASPAEKSKKLLEIKVTQVAASQQFRHKLNSASSMSGKAIFFAT